MSPNILKARYTGPKSRGESAARLARYIEDRKVPEQDREHGREQAREPDGPEQDEERNEERDRYEKATTFGDRGAFVEAARERAEEGRRSSYVHLVVSPDRGEDFEDRDFEKLLPDLVRDRQGNDCEYFAAVHRDSDHPHMHVGVVRDKYQKQELENLKEGTEGRIRSVERVREDIRPRDREEPEREERGPGVQRDTLHNYDEMRRSGGLLQVAEAREHTVARSLKDIKGERSELYDSAMRGNISWDKYLEGDYELSRRERSLGEERERAGMDVSYLEDKEMRDWRLRDEPERPEPGGPSGTGSRDREER